MQWMLIILGIFFLLISFLLEIPSIRNRITRPIILQEWAREENRVRQVRQDVERAREDVIILLEELDRASDKVVNLVADYAEKAQSVQDIQKPPYAQNTAENKVRSIKSSQPKASKKPVDDKYQKVYELATKGMPVDDIAQLTKIGKGEVELLLELKNRGGNR